MDDDDDDGGGGWDGEPKYEEYGTVTKATKFVRVTGERSLKT